MILKPGVSDMWLLSWQEQDILNEMMVVYFTTFINSGCTGTSFHCPVNFSYMHNKQIDGVMVGGLTSSLVDHGIQHSLVEANDFQIRICSFSAKYTALKE
jgi:hypothetical protein